MQGRCYRTTLLSSNLLKVLALRDNRHRSSSTRQDVVGSIEAALQDQRPALAESRRRTKKYTDWLQYEPAPLEQLGIYDRKSQLRMSTNIWETYTVLAGKVSVSVSVKVLVFGGSCSVSVRVLVFGGNVSVSITVFV